MDRTKLFIVSLLSLFSVAFGGSYFTRREFKDDPEGSLKYTLRSMELGLTADKQHELAKREFALRQMSACDDCDKPTMPDATCEYGYNPVIKNHNGTCSCVGGYECCKAPPCPTLTDADWTKCDKAPFGVGKYYPWRTENCCDCPIVVCHKCPEIVLSRPPADWGTDRKNVTHQYFWCDNECDEPVLVNKTEMAPNKCPEYTCRRKTGPSYKQPVCDTKCHEVETLTDRCGFHYEKCKCLYPPQCQPKKPEDIDCHDTNKVMLGYHGCDSTTVNSTQCVECFQWKYDLRKVENIVKTCKACEIEKVKDIGCGAYETVCQCRTPTNCRPSKPAEVNCHTIERIENADEESSMCSGNETCDRCYHWNLKPIPYTVKTATCDSRCQFKRPKSTTCGSDEECVPFGKSLLQCQPVKPATPACYDLVKTMIPGSYMFGGEIAEDDSTCGQCWTWEFKKKPCAVQAALSCKSNCQREVTEHTGCDCYVKKCVGTRITDCEPEKPTVDLVCYTDPTKGYRDVFTYDANADSCTRCFHWEYEPIVHPPIDSCELRHLPGKCFADYTVKGKCDSLITECRRNQLQCTELYDGTGPEVCPAGHTKVTLKTSCGDDRDACADCSSLVTKSWSDSYPEKCYDTVRMTVMGQCPVTIKRKKQCSYGGKLVATPCAIEGQRRKILIDECDCPSMVCAGCPTGKKINMQLILDSSGSITTARWTSLIEFLKLQVIDSIFTNKLSKLAIARFGTSTEVLQDWTDNASGDMLDSAKYTYKNMVNTFTGDCMESVFPAFQEATNGSDADKVVLVVTDGKWTPSSEDPKIAAAKYRNAGATVYAIGFGNLLLENLKEISPNNAYRLDDLDSAERTIAQIVVPGICSQPEITLD